MGISGLLCKVKTFVSLHNFAIIKAVWFSLVWGAAIIKMSFQIKPPLPKKLFSLMVEQYQNKLKVVDHIKVEPEKVFSSIFSLMQTRKEEMIYWLNYPTTEFSTEQTHENMTFPNKNLCEIVICSCNFYCVCILNNKWKVTAIYRER